MLFGTTTTPSANPVEPTTLSTSRCERTGAFHQVPAERTVSERFERALADVPADISTWDDSEVRALVAALETWDVEACEHTLATLASHGGAVAFELIAELRMELPTEVKEFAELAFARALGHLGFDYIRDPDDTAPRVVARAA